MKELVVVPVAVGLSEEASRGMASIFIQQATYRASIHNKGHQAGRRIVLKPGHVSVIAGSICHVPRMVCVTRRRGGCSLGHDSKRHERGPGLAKTGPVSGRRTET